MLFDIVVGNPPYHFNLNAGLNKIGAKPIYVNFVLNSFLFFSKLIIIIIPARWFSGGNYYREFLYKISKDTRITNMVYYKNSREVFYGVDIAGGLTIMLLNNKYNKTPALQISHFSVYE